MIKSNVQWSMFLDKLRRSCYRGTLARTKVSPCNYFEDLASVAKIYACPTFKLVAIEYFLLK